MKIVYITGCLGFIGSYVTRACLEKGWYVKGIDKITYAANAELLDEFNTYKNFTFVQCDINEIPFIHDCDYIINTAAETHVDNSIRDTNPFLKNNVVGVHNLLEIIRSKPKYERPLFVQISTDEVYGDRPNGEFQETDKLTPSNPYSASKAAAEMFVLGYYRTYGIDYLFTRSSNNYGQRQYSEKLIPKIIECINENKKIPLHGDGSYVRDWIYVKDNVDAIYHLIHSGAKNDVFNIGANNHMTNLEVALDLLIYFGKGKEAIQFIENRWGQDLRYSLNIDKINKFGWTAKQKKGILKWWI